MSDKRDPKWGQWGAALKQLREQSGRTQRELGKSSLMGKSTISSFELGTRSPRLHHAEALDTALSTGGTLARMWQEIANQRYVPEWFKDALQLERRAIEIRQHQRL